MFGVHTGNSVGTELLPGVRPLVVVAAGVSWDGAKMSDHHLASSLNKYADVLWVDAPQSFATRARFRGIDRRARQRRVKPELVPLSPTFVRLRTVALPGWSRPGIRSSTWPMARAQIRWALRKIGRRPAVFVAAHPHDLLGRWGEGVVDVLYGTDDWVAGAGLLNLDGRRVLAEERRAISRSDLVLAVSTELADRWGRLGAEPIVFPNGCDVETYARVSTAVPGPLPAGFPTPVAGVVGQLNQRIDVNVLAAVARANVGLLLVGPIDPRYMRADVEALLERPNVHHVGPVPFEEVPRWLAQIDVGLTPYSASDFNRASFPLKTLEYLAAGIPVVSTDLPASQLLRRDTNQVWIARDSAAFAEAVHEAARAAHIPELVSKRRAAAARYSWAARAEQFARLVGLTNSVPDRASGRSLPC